MNAVRRWFLCGFACRVRLRVYLPAVYRTLAATGVLPRTYATPHHLPARCYAALPHLCCLPPCTHTRVSHHRHCAHRLPGFAHVDKLARSIHALLRSAHRLPRYAPRDVPLFSFALAEDERTPALPHATLHNSSPFYTHFHLTVTPCLHPAHACHHLGGLRRASFCANKSVAHCLAPRLCARASLLPLPAAPLRLYCRATPACACSCRCCYAHFHHYQGYALPRRTSRSRRYLTRFATLPHLRSLTHLRHGSRRALCLPRRTGMATRVQA